MRSTIHRTRLAGLLAGMAVAAPVAAPAAYAMPADSGPGYRPPAVTRHADVAAPPSLMAESARDQYEELRAEAVNGGGTTLASQPVAGEPSAPGGFDWVSAAIGAVAAGGLSVVSLGAVGMRRHSGQRAASG